MAEITGDLLRGYLKTMILSVLNRGNAHGLEVLRANPRRNPDGARVSEKNL